MPRVKGSKNRSSLSTPEQIELTKNDIKEQEAMLKELKDHLKVLESKLEAENNSVLLEAFKQSGLSLSEALERIKE